MPQMSNSNLPRARPSWYCVMLAKSQQWQRHTCRFTTASLCSLPRTRLSLHLWRMKTLGQRNLLNCPARILQFVLAITTGLKKKQSQSKVIVSTYGIEPPINIFGLFYTRNQLYSWLTCVTWICMSYSSRSLDFNILMSELLQYM